MSQIVEADVGQSNAFLRDGAELFKEVFYFEVKLGGETLAAVSGGVFGLRKSRTNQSLLLDWKRFALPQPSRLSQEPTHSHLQASVV